MMTTFRNASGGSASPDMIDGALIARVCGEYREMPGLCLTVQQASRLWQLNQTDCTRILELLVAQHVLKRSATGRFIADDLRCPEGWIRREAQK